MFKDWWSVPRLLFGSGNVANWIGAVIWLICYPVVALLIAILGMLGGLVQMLWLWNLTRLGSDARTSDMGVEVFSKRRGHIATYAWSSISQLRWIFEPPGGYWELVLTSGEAVPLHIAELDAGEFLTRGIVVHDARKFRYEYERDC